MFIKSGGIIAAGEGSRFKKSGIKIHKPMILVAGFPLIGHALKNFETVGIKKVVIIFNETERECAEWVKNNFPRLLTEIIVKSTESSFESFWRVGKKCGLGRHLISTVDSICSAQELRKMVSVGARSKKNIYLGVTSFIDDEKPLWVKMNKKTKRIIDLGIPSGNYATAGFYNVPEEIFFTKPTMPISSLREYLKWLVQIGRKVYAVPLSQVIDVDVPNDIRLAEKMLGLKHTISIQ